MFKQRPYGLLAKNIYIKNNARILVQQCAGIPCQHTKLADCLPQVN